MRVDRCALHNVGAARHGGTGKLSVGVDLARQDDLSGVARDRVACYREYL